LYETIRSRFYHPQLKQECDRFNCRQCQHTKALGQGYGHLPPRTVPLAPWNEVAVDLIGPWKLEVNDQHLEFNALTCIDPVTNLVELVRIQNKTSEHIKDLFANTWLARYPRPNKCIHDNGGEFTGGPFQELLDRFGIRDAPTTARNPQGNSICERMHQTVANILRTLIHLNPPNDAAQAQHLVDNAIATAMHATRCAVNRTLGTSPGALAFRRDMLLDVPLIADWLTVQQNRQALVDANILRQNARRKDYHHRVGDSVLVKAVDPVKFAPRAHGPFSIVQVYTNGTVDIQKAPHIVEGINIRRLVPFR
jgi:transposase InsO family protein